MTAWFDPEAFTAEREARGVVWGRPVRLFESTSSTNDRALEALPTETKTGAVWLAREQSQGRGRRGNVWVSPPGDNLTCSFLLRLPGPPERAAGLSLLAGLAVRKAVADVLAPEREVQVKWPNDVYVDGKKIAGILVETRFDGGKEVGAVVGVGLNVQTAVFPAELPHATSLRIAGAPAAELAFERLLARLLGAFEARFKLYLPRGLAPLLDELDRYDFLRGRLVRVDDLEGRASGFDEHGGLRLAAESGEVRIARGGTVELVERSQMYSSRP